MPATIKSGASADLWTVDATSKAARGTLYDTSGNPISTAAGSALRTALYDASGNAVTVGSNRLLAYAYDSGGTALDATGTGTQAANAPGIQKLSDGSRTGGISPARFSWWAVDFTPSTSEALVGLKSSDLGGPGVNSYGVTANKILRLVSLTMSLNCASTTAVGGTCWLVMSASGTVTTSSAHVATVGIGLVGTQTAQNGVGEATAILDGLELSGTMQFGVTAKGIAAAGFNVSVVGYEY